MTSQWVERTWIRMGGYGWFRGEWVKQLQISGPRWDSNPYLLLMMINYGSVVIIESWSLVYKI